jgi:TRAP-type C4-dicarboxylate transport system permease small subunit
MSAPLATTARAPNGLERALGGLDRGITGLLLAAVAVMVTVVSAQVALRYGFNRSIDWADEVGRLAFVWSIFLAIPLGVRNGAHIGIDVAVDKLPAAWRAALKRAAAAISALMMAAIAWAALGVWFIVPVGIGALLSALHLVRIVVVGAPDARVGGAE